MGIANGNNPVSENILKIIQEKGLKQYAVAARAGYGRQEFNDMIKGRKIIKARDIKMIANTLVVTPNELYGLSMYEHTDTT